MDFSKTSRALEARALASSILEALIISLTNSSTHSAPSMERFFGADGSSEDTTSPLVAATPATWTWMLFLPLRDHKYQEATACKKLQYRNTNIGYKFIKLTNDDSNCGYILPQKAKSIFRQWSNYQPIFWSLPAMHPASISGCTTPSASLYINFNDGPFTSISGSSLLWLIKLGIHLMVYRWAGSDEKAPTKPDRLISVLLSQEMQGQFSWLRQLIMGSWNSYNIFHFLQI